MTSHDNLITELKQRQGTRNQKEFAAYLGIHESLFGQFYHGRAITRPAAQAIIKRYPELFALLAEILLASNEPQLQERIR